MGRRISRLETALKATLLVRSRSGLQLTATGAQLLQAGEQAEDAMMAAQRAGQLEHPAGTVRISASEGFGVEVIAPAMPDLRRMRPGLRIELAAATGFLSPSKREVDMAITLSAPDNARLVVEPLTNYQLALYAAPGYLAEHGTPVSVADLAGRDLVGYVADLIYAPELRYLEEIGPELRPTLSSSSIRAQRGVIAAGGGIGVLPLLPGGRPRPGGRRCAADTSLLAQHAPGGGQYGAHARRPDLAWSTRGAAPGRPPPVLARNDRFRTPGLRLHRHQDELADRAPRPLAGQGLLAPELHLDGDRTAPRGDDPAGSVRPCLRPRSAA